MRPEGLIIYARDAPLTSIPPRRPRRFRHSSFLVPEANHSDQRWATTLEAPNSRTADEGVQAGMTGGTSAALTPSTAPAETNAPAKGEWRAIQEAMRKGMSLRAIERE